jgi:hypothetical protein
LGIKKEKKFIPCNLKANIVTPMKIVILNPKVTIPLDVTAKEYGTLEIKLPIIRKKNKE